MFCIFFVLFLIVTLFLKVNGEEDINIINEEEEEEKQRLLSAAR